MAVKMDSQRQALIEQVLEYWYTVDFLSQGGLNTEETRRDRENWSFATKNPTRFSILYRHEDLLRESSILSRIRDVEELIKNKREEIAASLGMPSPFTKPPCHGKITVYLGAIEQAYLSTAIANELKCDPPLNPSSSKLALASLQLTEEGKYIKGSLSLSPIIWALTRIMTRQENASMYSTLDPAAFKESVEALEPKEEQEINTYQGLSGFLDEIIEKTVAPICSDNDEAGLEKKIHFTYSIYRDAGEREKRETDDYFGLSMSFYAEDLVKFRNAAAAGKWFSNEMWETLADYICAPYDMSKGVPRNHIDLGSDAIKDPDKREIARQNLQKILSVDWSPWGKWPSKYQPFFMQQVAINLAINQQDPIFAVNGPPGTGKTTLLKEIVAENVVQRALIMSEFDKPDKMFVYKELKIGKERRYIYSFKPEIEDIKRYGIVVASSNNNAVENISKQLPLAEVLRKGLESKSDDPYLRDVRRMFSEECAPLETTTRRNFEKEGQPLEEIQFHDFYFSSYAGELLREPCWGLLSAPLGKRSNVYAFYKKVLKQLQWDKYLQKSPDERLEKYLKAREEFKKQYDAVKETRETLKLLTDDAYDSFPEKNMFIGGRSEVFNENLFMDLASDNPETRKRAQMSCVHISRQYDEQRELLFGCALKLIKEFILSSAVCKSNLELLSCAWGVETYRNPFANLDPGERETALRQCMTPLIQTLQLMVPVISTTFASVGRFFRYVTKADALGTIIVDEAGQATPQMALSLFSKASRAIVVGDPNQIEPVVTDELAFLETTLDDEIGNAYSDRTISVQKIADYLSLYGSEQSDILGLYGKNWVGLPLYVHSRCIEPMFSISNRLSYGETMLRITTNPDKEKRFCYPTSQWINITGSAESDKNHFVRTQGERVLKLLEEAFARVAESGDEDKMNSGPDLFVISPFHTVAEGMRILLSNSMNEEHPILLQNREMVENWLIDDQNPHIGTVHTFQGREADEVILLLGCDEKSKRSANWVNRNIVNVAVSRAKYRLYVVGDEKTWRGCDPVMEMKFELDAYQFETIASAVEKADPDADLFDIPELPSSEMFDIEDVSEEAGEKEYAINTDSGISNVRAAIPDLAEEFNDDQLSCFGLSSMTEFEDRFDDKTKDLLRTGMWTYFWIKPFSEKMPDYDASTVGICLCKAYEQCLKRKYFVWLQKLFPNDMIHSGNKAGSIRADAAMIGDVTTLISNHISDLSALMNLEGYPECDLNWWKRLNNRIGTCRTYRNRCAHPGEKFMWTELEELIDDLFRGKEEDTGKVPGLMLEDTFPKVMAVYFVDWEKHEEKAIEQFIHESASAVETSGSVKYCPVYHKVHKCTADATALVQELVTVRKKEGATKKLHFLTCRQCGRRFINIATLAKTVHLDEYCLKPVKSEDW